MVLFRRILPFIICFILQVISVSLIAQPTRNGGSSITATGRLYGKVMDDSEGKPVEYAIVQLFRIIPGDSIGRKMITGAITESNGDFVLDGVPLNENFTLIVSITGYSTSETAVRLEPRQGYGMPEKDVGNVRLKQSVTLEAVEIVGETSEVTMKFGVRSYDVSKNPANAGGTAEDVMRNIPSLQVNLDGELSLRGQSPQIFIDGRPTTLSLQDIPADAIQKVEVIPNPSAKFDASGGGGGIVNVVMKHNRAIGYNGTIKTGVDKRGRLNGGIDLNAREGKVNLFVNANVNQRKNITTGSTVRHNLGGTETILYQSQQNISKGLMMSGKIGADWFMDNRNTFTLSQSFNRGIMHPLDYLEVQTDTLTEGSNINGLYYRNSITDRQWQNLTSSLLYKHLFAKEGNEINADVNYSLISSEITGDYENKYNDRQASALRQTGNTNQGLFTSQLDYSGIVSETLKLELGARVSVRTYDSDFINSNRDNETGEYFEIKKLQLNYGYREQVYAGYGTLSKDYEKWKVQLGLRVESSDYFAELKDTTLEFRNSYPLSLFPSLNLTRVINRKQDIQLSVNRKISRPSFMQLTPYTDYSDSLNISRGNPALKPEFTYSGELSYQNQITDKNTVIATFYGRYQTNLTVRYQQREFSPVAGEEVILNTYANALSSASYGLEIISRNNIAKWFSLTTNLNFYNSSINGSNIETSLKNNFSSWFAKVNSTFRLPSSFSLQLMGEYSSRRSLDANGGSRGNNSGGGGGGYGGGGWGGSNNTVQGYLNPIYSLDVTLKKDFFKEKNLTTSISFQDILRTRVNETYSESPYFTQEISRRRDPQFWRFSLSWKFGKMDASIFRRKNTNQSGDSMEG